MKLFTHVLVIYDKGFCFRWEEKPELKIWEMVYDISFLTFCGVAAKFVFGL